MLHTAQPHPAQALIIVAHGSRDPRALEDVYALGRATAVLAGMRCEVAVLDFAGPSLADAALTLAAAGYRAAAVVPLLFSPGFHARVDIPEEIARARAASGLELPLRPGLGCGEDIARVLAARVRNPRAELVLYAVGSARPEANDAVRALAETVEELTGQATTVAFATRGGLPADVRADLRAQVEVLPLFVAHGRLLPAGLEPLGEALAPVVAARAGIVVNVEVAA